MPRAEATVLALGHRFATLEIERAVFCGIGEVVDGNLLDAGEKTEALARARAILLGTRGRIDAADVDALESCRIIVRYGVGVDNVDVAAATRRGIVVSNVPEYAVEEVSDHALALLIAANRHLPQAMAAARARPWTSAAMSGVRRLALLTVGIVGFGRIGQAMARKVRALCARVIAFDPFVPSEQVRARGVEPVAFSQLLQLSDYVSIHCPLTPETRFLFDAEALARMRPNAWIVNTSRGEVIDEPALTAAIADRRIAGAALDVLTEEPPPEDHPLARLENVFLTPHVAYFSAEAMQDLQRMAAEEARRVLLGERPRSAVNQTPA